MTITEALAEVKLIQKKIDTKKPFIFQNLYRNELQKDPLGDSKKEIESEVQSIVDQYQRLIKIRAAIALANLNNTITIFDETMTIHDWLVYKREVGEKLVQIYATIQQSLQAHRNQISMRPEYVKDEKGENKFVTFVYNFEVQKAQEMVVKLQDILAKLDGQLSLKNATIDIGNV